MATATSRSRSDVPDLTIVGSPTDPRVRGFQSALARNGFASARVEDYTAIADGSAGPFDGGIIRLESPNRAPAIRRALYTLGAVPFAREGGSPIDGPTLDEMIADTGRIDRPRQYHLGLLSAMQIVEERSSGSFMNTPDEVALAFDKPRCQALLQHHGVPVPTQLGAVRGYVELREAMARQRAPRVFLKLRHGSAASGIVAFETMAMREQAWSTTEIERGPAHTVRLYNSRRVRRYTDPTEIRTLIDALCEQGVYVERWVPKAASGRGACDLRIVTIRGEPTHVVLRSANTPFTNLHLGGRRSDPNELRRRMPSDSWASLLDSCRRVADLFRGCAYLGLDVAVLRDLRRHAVLEVNAFGDFVKGVFAEGKGPYDVQLETLAP